MERTPPHPEKEQFDLQRVLEALVDPVRRSIVTQLDAAGEDIACGAFDIAVSKSTATHHFKVLREAGLIRQHYVGTSRMNALRRTEMDQAFPGLLDAITPRVAEAGANVASAARDTVSARRLQSQGIAAAGEQAPDPGGVSRQLDGPVVRRS